MYVFDQSGHFKSWNRNFETISGESKAQILRKHPLDFIAVEDRPAVQETMNKVFEEGFGTVEAGFLTRAGKSIPYLFTGYKHSQDNINMLIGVGVDISQRIRTELQKAKLIEKLQNTLSEVKQLSGLLPICASCKKIRDDQGYWNQIESYLHKHSEARFSHGLCPACSEEMYGNEQWYRQMKDKK